MCYNARVCEAVLPSASEGTVGRMVRGRSQVMVSTPTGWRPRLSSACKPERSSVGVDRVMSLAETLVDRNTKCNCHRTVTTERGGRRGELKRRSVFTGVQEQWRCVV